MKKSVVACVLMTLFASCAHSRNDQERGTAEYSHRAQQYTSNVTSPPTTTDPSLVAPVLALIGAATLGMNPDYYKSSYLGGRCVVRASATDPLDAPCSNLQIKLLEEGSGKEVGRKACDLAGGFKFSVETNRKYLLNVVSERYTLAARNQGPFVQGDQILMVLVPKELPAK